MIRHMRSLLRISIAASLTALVGALAWTGSSGAVSYAPAPPQPTVLVKPGQAGDLRLGDTIASLSERKLIGGLKPGCELDPGQRVAKLKPPLKGWALFFHGGKRLSSIVVEGGGETAAGIAVGSTVKAAKAAYPKAEYDRPGSLEPFPQGFLWVNNSRKPKMTFLVEQKHNRVSSINLPSPNFCE
jgi:hypothetical protein